MIFLIIIMKTVIGFIYNIHSLAPCKTFVLLVSFICKGDEIAIPLSVHVLFFFEFGISLLISIASFLNEKK